MTVICDVRNNAMYNLVVIEFPDGSLSGFLGGMIGVGLGLGKQVVLMI